MIFPTLLIVKNALKRKICSPINSPYNQRNNYCHCESFSFPIDTVAKYDHKEKIKGSDNFFADIYVALQFFYFFYYHPKPLGTNQEITNYDVAASELLNPLCLIIDAVCIQTRKKGENECRIQNLECRIRHTTCDIRYTTQNQRLTCAIGISVYFLRGSSRPSW